MSKVNGKTAARKTLPLSAEKILRDYKIAYQSRQASLLGRKEVMGGKAKFGILGDGKEVPQLAMAHVFQPGDFRSGYYRDQTFMFATGMTTIQEYFAQLYGHADPEAEPATAGRGMNAHFGTISLNPDGSWKNLSGQMNCSSDISPTASQMPRLVGLGYASRLFRQLDALKQFTQFSRNGDEIAFGTIGNASCAEGLFWESINAIGVLQAPVLLSIWDDDYGISVTNEYQHTKANIYELLKGFQRKGRTTPGFELHTVRGWDYPALIKLYQRVASAVRKNHIPAIIHVAELTQPQGHSTSGSHERYKSKERLEWEKEHDCLKKMREWMISAGVATSKELDRLEKDEARQVISIRDAAWEAFNDPIKKDRDHVAALIDTLAQQSAQKDALLRIKSELLGIAYPLRRYNLEAAHKALLLAREEPNPALTALAEWCRKYDEENKERYGSHLYSETEDSALSVPEIKAVYSPSPRKIPGFEILNACFDAILAREPRFLAFGEDVGRLGDVNQGFKGLQEKYGELRVSDTGIREATILGQAIGMAMRGLRPLAEIQYLDYLLYALQIMSDDLATLHWRTRGGQKAPVIVRTRGHRLEGVWHSGSPMAGILNLLRGMWILVPRDMTQAAGFYNTLLRAEEPALVIEVLNGYRLREPVPDNLAEFTIPLGVPEILRTGNDLTVVTYGACCRVVMAAADMLHQAGIEIEVIDVRSLLPFDRPQMILNSLKKTSRVLFVDEDFPGGATAYMLQQVVEEQNGYRWLDSEPQTLSAPAHRPAYGSDGDYWSKPNAEQVFRAAYRIMHEAEPAKYPLFF